MLKRDDGWIWRASSTGSSRTSREKDAFPGGAERPPVAAARRRGRAGTSRSAPRYAEYVAQPARQGRVGRTRCARRSGGVEDYQQLPPGWLERRSSCTPRRCRWPSSPRSSATCAPRASAATAPGGRRRCFGALDEMRHTQIPLLLMHELVRWDPQFDWTHKFFHTEQLGRDRRAPPGRRAAARRPNAIEFAIATNFVFETGLHQPAVRRAVGARARRRRPDVREDGEQHPDRRGAPRPDRRARARDRGRARPRATRSTCSTSGSGGAGCCSRSSPASRWTT